MVPMLMEKEQANEAMKIGGVGSVREETE
jgi:hypothetical protein